MAALSFSSSGSVRYSTIVADPPWDYGTEKTRWATASFGKAMSHSQMPYESMSLADIKALDLSGLAAQDCRLFLWTTSRYLGYGFDVLDAWGFDYRQALIWHKTGNPSPFGGSVAPNHAEFLLVAVKGSPSRLSRLPSSVIAAPKPTTEHSRKPDVFLDLIESVSPGPYLELFARRNRLGWDTYGNEALNHVEVP